MQCQNNLRRLALATLNFESAARQFPPGVRQTLFTTAPVYRGSSLFVYVLPNIEEAKLRQAWDFTDPGNNTPPACDGANRHGAADVAVPLGLDRSESGHVQLARTTG